MRVLNPSILGALCALLAGCASEQPKAAGDATKKPKQLRIAVIPKGATHEFWKSVHAGANDAAAELGDVQIMWKGPLKEDDRDSQIRVVEDMVNAGVDGIVLAPLDDTALRAPVQQAVKNSIPVVIIDSGLKDAETVSFVATDNFKGGQMAGEQMVKLLNGRGNVILLRYQVGSASTDAREKGFLDALSKAPGIKLVSDNQFAGATTESAQATSENLLGGFRAPDGSLRADGIFTPNESSTFGMLRVLQDNNWAGKVKFVGFDASPKLVEALKAGQIDGLIVQNPRRMGYLGVKTLAAKLSGGAVEARIDTGATLVTRDNMNSPEIQKLLAPPPQ